MFTLSKTTAAGKELRTCVVDTLVELMDENNQLVALDADLGSASGWTAIANKHPQRFINMGIDRRNDYANVLRLLSLADILFTGRSYTNPRPHRP